MAGKNKTKTGKKGQTRDRFEQLSRDNRYGKAQKKEKNVELDERFASLTTDSDFGTSIKMDQYGRTVGDNENELLQMYKSQGIKLTKKEIRDMQKEEAQEHDDEAAASIIDELQEDIPDAPTYEIIADETKRLALANVSWANITADDIMVLFNSFCPPGGSVKNVSIYISNFGKERLAIEAEHGPGPILDEYAEEARSKDKFPKELEEYKDYAIRAYEQARMRYYFAVATFDSPASALTVYAQCDGMDFEASGDVLDLSFVPDEQDLSSYEIHAFVDKMPALYVPKELGLINQATSKTKVELQWEKENVTQRRLMNLAFEGNIDQYDDDAFNDLLAPASEDEEIDTSKKYKDLIEEIQSREEEEATMEEFKVKFGSLTDNMDAAEAKKYVESYTAAEKLLKKQDVEAQLDIIETDAEDNLDAEDISSLASLAESNKDVAKERKIETSLDSRFAAVMDDDDFALDIEHAEFKLNKETNKEIIKKQIAAKSGRKNDESLTVTAKARRR